ncbi:MAG: hypothetical protein J6I47_01315 [Ruminococcus sp.]|nr:hypothetical protein [Ruminococcus sp.]
MKKFNGWKKILAFTFALALVAAPLTANSQSLLKGGSSIVAAAAETAEEPAAVPDTIERDGITYFNVNSQNFNSTKKFFLDMFNTKREISDYATDYLGRTYCVATKNISLGEQ